MSLAIRGRIYIIIPIYLDIVIREVILMKRNVGSSIDEIDDDMQRYFLADAATPPCDARQMGGNVCPRQVSQVVPYLTTDWAYPIYLRWVHTPQGGYLCTEKSGAVLIRLLVTELPGRSG